MPLINSSAAQRRFGYSNFFGLAQEIVDRLGLTQESAGDRSRKIRYVSAWFDDELTKLEGAE